MSVCSTGVVLVYADENGVNDRRILVCGDNANNWVLDGCDPVHVSADDDSVHLFISEKSMSVCLSVSQTICLLRFNYHIHNLHNRFYKNDNKQWFNKK